MAFISAISLSNHKTYGSPLTCSRRVYTPIVPKMCAAVSQTQTQVTDVKLDAQQLSKNVDQVDTVMDIEGIMKILPHRYPFLLIDRVIAYEPNQSAITCKQVTMNEPFFPGHFPNRPIMPGVLQVEALAQTGGIVMLQHEDALKGGDFFFGGVDKVKWRKPVVPGDCLVMEMKLETFKKKFGIAKMSGKGYVRGDLVVEGNMTLVMVQ